MTFARPVGTLPTGPASLDRTIGRAGVFAGVGVLAALNAQAEPIIGAFAYFSLPQLIGNLGGISAVIWFAMYAALKIGIEDKPESLRRWDIPVLAAAIVFSFIPMAFAAKLGLLLTGGYLFAASTRGSAERRIALLLLALTGPLIWGRLILVAFAAPILALDARLVGSAIGSNVDGNLVQFAGGSKIFVIGNGCSSLHNMSLAIVLWTTAAVLFEIRIDRRYVAIGGAMVAWMFLLNIARLASIGLFPKDFDLLHVGAGAALFGWAGLIGAALLAGLGVASAVRPQR